MQFNLTDGPPSTWQRYRIDGNHDGTTDVYDRDDAIHSAGNYLRTLLRNADGDVRQAIFGYNHSQAYVNDVLARAGNYAGELGVSVDGCAGGLDAPAGPADVRTARSLTAPRAFRTLPTWAMAGGRAPQAVDARIYDDVLWLLRRHHLRVTAAREPGHQTHGDGTAVDLVPADGITQAVWDASAGELVHDLGWTPGCGSSGTRPSCPLVPAIQFIGYDGYPNHGSPRTCNASCPAHIHISWVSPCYGTSDLSAPCRSVTAFAATPPEDASSIPQRAPGQRSAGHP
jgi:hypothetical protein